MPTINEAIANAEYVIEGEILPGVRVQEDQNSHTVKAMPEFPAYRGLASFPADHQGQSRDHRFQADLDLIPIPGGAAPPAGPLQPADMPPASALAA